METATQVSPDSSVQLSERAEEALKQDQGTNKILTLKEYKMHFTVRHGTVDPCGHKLDAQREPRINCPYCWFVFFQTHGELVQTSDEVFQKYGRKALEQIKGTKFMKNFLRFMATLALMKKQVEEGQKEKDGQQSTGQLGTSGESAGESIGQFGGLQTTTAIEATVDGRKVESA